VSDIDQQFIEYVVKSLVGKPEAVQVERRIDEKGVLLELTVDPEDLGRVIGKRGATAQSLRTLLRALGTKNDARYNLKIIDNGAPRPPATDDQASSSSSTGSSDDDTATPDLDNQPAPAPKADSEEPPQEPEAEPEAEAPKEETSDRLAQTRKELADLDDLDV
jgi:hypothetical protein